MATVDIYKKNHRNEISDGYKKTQIGIIPKSWDVKTLSDIGEISSGSTPSRSNENYFNGNIPWVKTTDLNNSYIFETEEKITELALKETSLKLVEENSILIAMYGGFNQIGRTGLLRVKAATNQAISSVFVDEKEYNAEFVLHWLNAKRGLWKKFAASSRKDPNITKNDVENFPIVKPPYREQKRIAQILSTWDKAIELKEKLIEQKKEQKKGLMQRLLTGKVRLSELEWEWEEVQVKDVCEIGRGRVISKKEIEQNQGIYPVYSSQTSNNGEIGRINTYDYDGEYITWTTDGVNAGTVFYRKGKFNCTNVCGTLKLLRNDIDARYFALMLQGQTDKYVVRHGNPKLMNNVMAIITVRIFNNYEFQKFICDIFDIADREIALLEQEVEALKQQKKGLMQLLLTGKVRVKC